MESDELTYKQKQFKKEEELLQKYGDEFTVPVNGSSFGYYVSHDLEKGPVIVLHRNFHGWKAPEGDLSFAKLKHQIYIHEMEECLGSIEIMIHSLESGLCQTIWAEKEKEIQFPEPSSYNGGENGR